MKVAICCIILIVEFFGLPSSTFAQQTAVAVYNKSNKMISVSGLSPKRDCGKRIVTGTVKKVDTDSSESHIEISVGKKTTEMIELHLDVLSNVDRTNIFYSLLKKGQLISVEGYTCGSNGVLDAISIKLAAKKK